MSWLHLLLTPSSAVGSIRFWFLCVSTLAGLYGFISAVASVARKKDSAVFWTPKQKLIAALSSGMNKAGTLMLGIVIGAGAMALYLMSNVHIWTNVRVIERNAPEYALSIDRSEYHVRFCPENAPNWYPGYVIDRVVAVRIGDCFSLQPHGTQYKIARR